MQSYSQCRSQQQAVLATPTRRVQMPDWSMPSEHGIATVTSGMHHTATIKPPLMVPVNSHHGKAQQIVSSSKQVRSQEYSPTLMEAEFLIITTMLTTAATSTSSIAQRSVSILTTMTTASLTRMTIVLLILILTKPTQMETASATHVTI